MTMTMGIVLVASLATRIAGSSPEIRTSTLSCTSSATRLGTRSRLSLSVAKLNQDVFPLDITEILQPLAKCFNVRPRNRGHANHSHVPDSRNLSGLLRFGGRAKRQEHGAKRYTQNGFPHCLPLTPHFSLFTTHAYLITRSALNSTDCGIVRLSAFAVFRLITNSNFVGCSTGRSAGLVPLRILST